MACHQAEARNTTTCCLNETLNAVGYITKSNKNGAGKTKKGYLKAEGQ